MGRTGKETGESALFRQLFDQLRAGDVVVADRYYCSYFMIALLAAHGVDVVFRLHHVRHYDFRRGQRLGQADHVVEWQRPQRPTWMSHSDLRRHAGNVTVRELRFHVDDPGFRTDEIVAATTLLDDPTYRKADIAELYHQRWQAELDLRPIKRTLGMERLTCKTPAMVGKELWAHLLATIWGGKGGAGGVGTRLVSRQISFAGTVQTLEAFRDLLLATDQHVLICRQMFEAIATHEVGDRPGRVEPRYIKRRQGNQYPTLKIPRDQRMRNCWTRRRNDYTRRAQPHFEGVHNGIRVATKKPPTCGAQECAPRRPIARAPRPTDQPQDPRQSVHPTKPQPLNSTADRMEVPFTFSPV